jgi:hypothetical protein
MDERFSEIAKALASGLSRRDALRRLVGTAAGGVLAFIGLGRSAQAQAPGTCPALCRALGVSPGGGNAFGKCVSNCSGCLQGGGIPCGTDACCSGEEVCCPGSLPGGECVSCPEGTVLNPATCECDDLQACDDPGICGDATVCGDSPGCLCIERVGGGGFCHDIVFCNLIEPCENQGDCAHLPGWACAFSCCGGELQAFCHPPCGAGLDPAVAAAGAGPRSGPGV